MKDKYTSSTISGQAFAKKVAGSPVKLAKATAYTTVGVVGFAVGFAIGITRELLPKKKACPLAEEEPITSDRESPFTALEVIQVEMRPAVNTVNSSAEVAAINHTALA